MSTAATPQKHEWLCVVPDAPGMRAKRIAVRQQHFAGLKPLVEAGLVTWGGAMLDDLPTDDNAENFSFNGSAMTVVAATREEVLDALNQDVYAKEGVWDVSKAQITPFRCALRMPLEKK